MTGTLLVSGLTVSFRTPYGDVIALDSVDLAVPSGGSLGVIGESGSGKTTLVGALSGALNSPTTHVSGAVRFGDTSVLDLQGAALRRYRRHELAYIGQDPHGSLNPTATVRTQLLQALDLRSRKSSESQVLSSLERVGFPRPDVVAASYPFQLSGGMAQRVAIAVALARGPALVVADEPTSALDSTLRTHILTLLTGLVADTGATLIMVSHDLRAVQRFCASTAVMYGGTIAEVGRTETIFRSPRHPYTAGLLQCAPGSEAPGTRLEGIPGLQAARLETHGCAFADRCKYRLADCRTTVPAKRQDALRTVACHRSQELELRGW